MSVVGVLGINNDFGFNKISYFHEQVFYLE